MDGGFQLNALDPRSLSDLQRLSREQPDSPETLRAAAKQFEALFLQMALKAMRQATPQNGLFDNEHTRTYQSLLDQQLALQLAHSRNNGMSDVLFRQLGGLNGKSGGSAIDALETGGSASGGTGLDGLDLAVAAQTAKAAASLERQGLLPATETAGDDPVGALIAQLQAARGSARAAVGGTSAVAASAAVEEGGGTAPSGKEAFVREIWPHAQAVSRETGIPARFIVAHAALETGWGEKILHHADGRSSYNLFNIKAGSAWQGETVSRTVKEYAGGTSYSEQARFRSYGSYTEAFRDYARLLSDSPRYAGVLGQTDAAGFARGLQQAGYATDPRYAAKLAGVIGGSTLKSALAA
ncbi:flagellar assembly peptidoglycan hydrolase FlgJ [Pseudothauera rhizosphaerae]|uniref:Peptidoglycan hydrolase FlgJ n=1 Tax=Pseudothauera rhizosphaerae TaxID=2565932 RepID=A0A4S4AWN6_9RHOO|nr:flagellar assembly peptidoglycan hydrolase FlgJ [Pseudothauera rhizosphaerae]THF64450.1 flagellar assembly peptidoglycan hydrolase FlgJ [Pseudothauera rhizosphaerae]